MGLGGGEEKKKVTAEFCSVKKPLPSLISVCQELKMPGASIGFILSLPSFSDGGKGKNPSEL